MALASVMATLMVRGLDEEVRQRLKERAASNGRSMEAEVRAILSAAVMPHDPGPGAGGPVTVPGPLTAQEDRIAALVAQGWSNRQIADSFALSERTVEAHVSAILRKVGVRNRAAVASWFTARGAAPVPR